VFHPRYFISSECFAEFIGGLDLSGKHVVDIGTGSGILALAAARAGAENVTATDINPNAALTAAENAPPTAWTTASPPCALISSRRLRPARSST
jgi:methylase of polypeptide subunit release factors